MAESDAEGIETMRCHNQGCPGEYERQLVTRAFEPRGQVVVVAQIPADVCSVCGDTLFSWDTSQRLEALLAAPPAPERMVPLYTFPTAADSATESPVIEFAAGQRRAGR